MGGFILNSILLGLALAMDAFSVSLASGLKEPDMRPGRMFSICGVFAGFQFLMPVIGWLVVHTAAEAFPLLEKIVPWAALAVLLFLGIKMIIEGLKGGGDEMSAGMDLKTLLLMGVATSIDALSVGLAITDYGAGDALLSALIIGAVTLIVCLLGIFAGKKLGMLLAGRASMLGGIILIAIGIEIFVKGVF